jgi:hypothetical protein
MGRRSGAHVPDRDRVLAADGQPLAGRREGERPDRAVVGQPPLLAAGRVPQRERPQPAASRQRPTVWRERQAEHHPVVRGQPARRPIIRQLQQRDRPLPDAGRQRPTARREGDRRRRRRPADDLAARAAGGRVPDRHVPVERRQRFGGDDQRGASHDQPGAHRDASQQDGLLAA